ncbi:MAG: L-threonylcarbamoyladenylate synthase [Patescibacteria group bacterium]
MLVVKANKKGIEQAVKILKSGGVIFYPTDTAYGLGGIFDSPAVTKRILKIKKRQDKKFTLVAANLAQVKKFFKLDPTAESLAEKHWPGPLSVVVSSRFAIRVPQNGVAQLLARRVGRPLIATSANITGRNNIYQVKKIIKEFSHQKQQPDLILASGTLKRVKPSTLVKVVRGRVEVLRVGPIKFKSQNSKVKIVNHKSKVINF